MFAALGGHRAARWPGRRRGLFRRIADELGDLQRVRAQLRTAEADMVTMLGELGLSRLAASRG